MLSLRWRVRHKTLMFSPDLPLWLAFLVSGSAMTLVVIIRYFASSGLFAWMTQRLRPGHYAGQGNQILAEIRWSLIAAVFYGAPTGLIFWGWRHHGWTQMYVDAAEWPLWYIPVSIFVYLFVQDSWFYWTHRAMHWPRLFRIAHAVHHQSKPHRLDRDELPSGGIADRGDCHPGDGVRSPDPCRRAGDGARDRHGDGGHQSHGVGDIPAPFRSFSVGTLGDNRQPSRTAS